MKTTSSLLFSVLCYLFDKNIEFDFQSNYIYFSYPSTWVPWPDMPCSGKIAWNYSLTAKGVTEAF